MKKLTLFAVFVFIIFSLNSQTITNKFNIEKYMNDTTYYWGMNSAPCPQNEAIDISISNLYRNIADNCRPNALYWGNEDQSTQLYNIISTFENKINEKVYKEKIEENEYKQCIYFVYLKRSDFRKMCAERKKKIEGFAARGYRNENEDYPELKEALRSYYWGWVLCNAHPYGGSLRIKVNDEVIDDAHEWLVERINGPEGVLRSFSFHVPKDALIEETDEGLTFELRAYSISDSPITNLEFTYNNGDNATNAIVSDGKALITKQDNQDEVIISISFNNMLGYYPDVDKAIKIIKPNHKFFENSYSVNVKHIQSNKFAKLAQSVQAFWENTNINDTTYSSNDIEMPAEVEEILQNADDKLLDSLLSYHPEEEVIEIEDQIEEPKELKWEIDETFKTEDHPEYVSIMQEIENALRNKKHYSVKHHFTDEGFGMLDTLSKYGEMIVVGEQTYNTYKIGNRVVCRAINMQFNFKNNTSFNRDVIFRFNAETKQIESLAFRLSNMAEQNILSHNRWKKEVCYTLINFLEDYQTAYALKRIEYLDNIFSENALIIVGHSVNKATAEDLRDSHKFEFDSTKANPTMIQRNRNEYFDNLRTTFKSQEYINIEFTETEFNKAPLPDRDIIFVNMFQKYYSRTYNDLGFLYLLVDLTDVIRPIIHVRMWHPDKGDFDELSKIGLEHIKFY